jgi:hypothetical protein
MYQYEKNELQTLNCEDRARMGRLFEEINGRIQEINTMMNRIHGTSLCWTKFIISSASASSNTGIPILTVVCNQETGDCGCYDHEAARVALVLR